MMIPCRQHRYLGPLKAAILDWAGTVVDHGCMAPVAAFMQAFAAAGVPITATEARLPMGMAKWHHIRAIADQPRIASVWKKRYEQPPSDGDVDRLYSEFLPLQTQVVEENAELIEGALMTLQGLRARGLKIGSTTGYPRAVMNVVAARAGAQGYVVDTIVTAEDTRRGRPSPFPAMRALSDLDVFPVEAAVKIGDTVVDVEEGLNGGMWTIAVAVAGNEVGLSPMEWKALPEHERSRLRQVAYDRLYAAGAHYVVDSIADVLPVVDDIAARLAWGEKP